MRNCIKLHQEEERTVCYTKIERKRRSTVRWGVELYKLQTRRRRRRDVTKAKRVLSSSSLFSSCIMDRSIPDPLFFFFPSFPLSPFPLTLVVVMSHRIVREGRKIIRLLQEEDGAKPSFGPWWRPARPQSRVDRWQSHCIAPHCISPGPAHCTLPLLYSTLFKCRWAPVANGARRRRRGRRRQGINKKVFLLFLPFHLTVVEASPFVLPYFFIMQTEISLKERERTSIKEKIKGNVNVGGPIPTGPKGKKKKKRQMRQRLIKDTTKAAKRHWTRRRRTSSSSTTDQRGAINDSTTSHSHSSDLNLVYFPIIFWSWFPDGNN